MRHSILSSAVFSIDFILRHTSLHWVAAASPGIYPNSFNLDMPCVWLLYQKSVINFIGFHWVICPSVLITEKCCVWFFKLQFRDIIHIPYSLIQFVHLQSTAIFSIFTWFATITAINFRTFLSPPILISSPSPHLPSPQS